MSCAEPDSAGGQLKECEQYGRTNYKHERESVREGGEVYLIAHY